MEEFYVFILFFLLLTQNTLLHIIPVRWPTYTYLKDLEDLTCKHSGDQVIGPWQSGYLVFLNA